MDGKCYLIVNADDFGRSPGVNRGIIRARERGIVTSASLMVRWPAAVEAAAYSRDHPEFSVGLHVDLGTWIYRNGVWEILYEVVSPEDRIAVRDEVTRQLDNFRRLLGRDPTHIDSHQHAHRVDPARAILLEIARDLGVPLRHFTPTIRYYGGFYGQTPEGVPLSQAISTEALIRILTSLSPGITELSCHPGEDDDIFTMYCQERSQEVKALCDPQVQAVITRIGIELHSFLTIPFPNDHRQRVS